MKAAEKGAGSFWLPAKTIDALTRAKATAAEIAALLIIAKHTEAKGQYSTAGQQAIYKHGGMSQGAAQKAVEALLLISVDGKRKTAREPKNTKQLKRLLYTAEDWLRLTGEDLPHGPGARSQVRFVINTLDTQQTEGVWFGAGLVEGVGSFDRPMRRLRLLGDIAARLLLLLYKNNDMETWAGVSPFGTLYVRYERKLLNEEDPYLPIGVGRYAIEHWAKKHPTSWLADETCYIPRSAAPEVQEEYVERFWRAVGGLQKSGFIYEAVTVATNPNYSDESDAAEGAAEPLYELDVRSLHGFKPEGEKGLAANTARIGERYGYPVTDVYGSFINRYAAVAPDGMSIQVIGIFRLRFRVANPKNHGVSSSWAAIYERQGEGAEWISELLE